jgi:ketosteroid isomerase-like protein
MRKIFPGITAAIVAIGAGLGSGLYAVAADQQHDEVLQIVGEFHAALSRGDEAAVLRLLDPAVLIMEAGNVERTRQEYAEHHLKADAEFMRSVTYALKRQTGDSMGDLAWVATEATLTGESKGKQLNLASTESLVLKRVSAGWRIVHVHWSSRERGPE